MKPRFLKKSLKGNKNRFFNLHNIPFDVRPLREGYGFWDVQLNEIQIYICGLFINRRYISYVDRQHFRLRSFASLFSHLSPGLKGHSNRFSVWYILILVSFNTGINLYCNTIGERVTCRVSKAQKLSKETAKLDSHVIRSCSLKPRHICKPAGFKGSDWGCPHVGCRLKFFITLSVVS